MTLLDSERIDSIKRCMMDMPPNGEVWELGVFRGGTSLEMLKFMRNQNMRNAFKLFDTFKGISGTGPKDNFHIDGDFSDTSLDDVKHLLRDFDNAQFFPGVIPSTLISHSGPVSLVHIDLDVYEPTLASLRYIWTILGAGGFAVCDDYQADNCLGVKKAIDEFLLETPNAVATIGPYPQIVLRKHE